MSPKSETSLASLRPGMSRSGLAIKVKVERGQRSTIPPPPPPPIPVAPAITKKSPTQSPRRSARHPISELPVAQRQKLMWGIVGAGVVVVVVGWAMTFGANIRGANGDVGLFTDIAKIFRANRSSQTDAKQSAEIRKYQEQVFPQFQSR